LIDNKTMAVTARRVLAIASLVLQSDTCYAKDIFLQPKLETHANITNLSTVAGLSNSCKKPLKFTALPNSISINSYKKARTKCTDKCNANGNCCTLGMGGCQKVPCTTGCHIAFFSPSLNKCKEQCELANNNGSCEYTWHHDMTGYAGFNPWYKHGVGVQKCWGALDCGCPDGNFGNDCSGDACLLGCDLAHSADLRDSFFHGEEVIVDEKMDLDENALLDSIAKLTSHVDGDSTLGVKQMANVMRIFEKNSLRIDTNFDALDASFNLVDMYETKYGPLFLNSKTKGGFPRKGSDTYRLLERTMLTVQASILDAVYSGTRVGKRYHETIIENCADYVDGRKWLTSSFFPGPVAQPEDPGAKHSIDIDAVLPPHWGIPLCYHEEHLLRPTGFYLSPGGVATVKVPPALVGKGFRIQVGASTADNSNKNDHKRMDRVTCTYEISRTVTHIASPLGGGIYISVPYEANEGVVVIEISGGVVQAPIFSITKTHTTSKEEWNNKLKTSPAPWADFISDFFFMQVPTIWINKYNYDHLKTVLEGHEDALTGVSNIFGYPKEKRNNYILYVQPDLHIRHGAYGVGYPQINVNMQSGPKGPIIDNGMDGQSDHWFVSKPFLQNSVCYHELGHCNAPIYYRGETEAIVNFFIAYVFNKKVGLDFDTSFELTNRGPSYDPDGAAVHWMVTPNFRMGKEMDHSNTEYDEMRYQKRGYAKYADFVRLFGWEKFKDFNDQVQSDFMAGSTGLEELYKSDDRTLRLSVAAGVDLTPLIHFWGIHPVDSVGLKKKMKNKNLEMSNDVFNLLKRYIDLVPRSNAQFRAFYEDAYPNPENCSSPLYGCGWFEVWVKKYDSSHGIKAVKAANDIINLYFDSNPTSIPTVTSPSATAHPTFTPTILPTQSPTVKPKPLCQDSRKVFTIRKIKLTCNDLRHGKYRKKCKKNKYIKKCPVACGTCTGSPVCRNAILKVKVNKTRKHCKKLVQADCELTGMYELCPNTCMPKLTTLSTKQYTEARSQCIERCNAGGNCCTLGAGGCAKVPCATGCHIAFFSASLNKCKEQCISANNNGKCDYTWHHEMIGDAGFNPSWKYGVGVRKCNGAKQCGCPKDDFGDDCGGDACIKGCNLAHGKASRCSFFHGEDVTVL